MASRLEALKEPLLPAASEEPESPPSRREPRPRRCTPALQLLPTRWLFLWVVPVLDRGRLAIADLAPSGQQWEVSHADDRLQRRRQLHPAEGLGRALVAVFLPQMAAAACLKFVADVLKYAPPLLLSQLLSRLREQQREDADESATSAYALALALPLCALVQAMLVNQYFWRVLRLGILVRGAVASTVCRRALRYRLHEAVDGGRVANLLSSDCGRLNNVCGSLCTLWSSPLQIALAVGLLLRTLGTPVLAGLGVMVALMPAQMAISRALAVQRGRVASATDARLQRTEV